MSEFERGEAYWRQRVHEVADECQRRHAPYVKRCAHFDLIAAWARREWDEWADKPRPWGWESSLVRSFVMSVIEERDQLREQLAALDPHAARLAAQRPTPAPTEES